MDIIEAIKYFLIGIVQGITEVLPISSSGHVEIMKHLFNVGLSSDDAESIMFLILVNTGSLLTFVLIYFKRLKEMIVDFLVFTFKPEKRDETRENFIFLSKILVACIPAGVVGLALNNTIDNALINYDLLIVGVGLLFTSTVLILISQYKFHNKSFHFTWLDSIFIGLAQAVAIVPGVSRSGMTTSMAIKRGSGIDSALNFSFILYIPISFGSLLLMIVKAFSGGISVPGSEFYLYYLLAFVGALLATYFAYRIIFNIFKSGKIKYFAVYCLIVGLGSVFWFLAN